MNTENESRKLEARDQLGPLQMDNPGARGVRGRSKAQLQTLHRRLLYRPPVKRTGTLSAILKTHSICFRAGER